jgi:hypothetical protein
MELVLSACDSVQFDNVFAAVGWIADEALPGGIDDKIE